MSKTAISQYSATPSSNSDVDGIDISEGCPASNLNNAQRSLMSHLKEMDDGTSALTSPSMGQLNVDNLRLDGNTISSTDTNGDVQIDPAGTGQISLSAPVEVQSTGGATPTYSHTNNGEGLTFRYNDDSGARAADIVATGNTPAGATMAMRFFTSPNSTDAAAEVMRLQNGQSYFFGAPQNSGQANFYSVSEWAISVRRPSAGSAGMIRFENGSSGVGGITTSTTATQYNTSSDYRLKTAVNYDWDATTRLKQLKPARFKWISDGDNGVPVDGFIAHEVQTIVPEAISGTKDEVDDDGNPVMQGIDQAKIVPLLVKTIQELEARITALEAE